MDWFFKLNAPRPYRLHLKTGLVSNDLEKDLKIDGVYGRKIDGGAALLLDMPLNNTKILRKISVETVANDVIIEHNVCNFAAPKSDDQRQFVDLQHFVK